MSTEKKSLHEWLNEVGQDKEVTDTFFRDGVEDAVDLALKKHPGGEDHEHLLKKKNNCHDICQALQAEGADDPGGYSVHQFWVLVRI